MPEKSPPGTPHQELPKTPEELDKLLKSARLEGAQKAIGAVVNALSQDFTVIGGHKELFEAGQPSSLPLMMKGIEDGLNTLRTWKEAARQERIRFGQNEVGINTVLIVPEENQSPGKP